MRETIKTCSIHTRFIAHHRMHVQRSSYLTHILRKHNSKYTNGALAL